jgi:V/A-type H+-transporting ATPase subunit E
MNVERAHIPSSGVEALIERLKEQGVAAGQEKAENIVIDVQQRTEWISEQEEIDA